MKFILYFDSQTSPLQASANTGFQEAMTIAKALQRKGLPLKLVNTERLNAEEVQKGYSAAVVASVQKKYRIRQIFGSRRRSGWLFGRGVPALLVYGQSEKVPDEVYPHEQLGRVVTIKEFLDGVGATDQGWSRAPQKS